MDQHGKQRKLSEFIGEKHVLLDFIVAYCTPCVKAEEELMELQDEYADRLQIVSFWRDKQEKHWKKGLAIHTTDWPNLWDGEGYYGETVLEYGGRATPTFFLIDSNGKIIDKWIGHTQGQIESKLKENL